MFVDIQCKMDIIPSEYLDKFKSFDNITVLNHNEFNPPMIEFNDIEILNYNFSLNLLILSDFNNNDFPLSLDYFLVTDVIDHKKTD